MQPHAASAPPGGGRQQDLETEARALLPSYKALDKCMNEGRDIGVFGSLLQQLQLKPALRGYLQNMMEEENASPLPGAGKEDTGPLCRISVEVMHQQNESELSDNWKTPLEAVKPRPSAAAGTAWGAQASRSAADQPVQGAVPASRPSPAFLWAKRAAVQSLLGLVLQAMPSNPDLAAAVQGSRLLPPDMRTRSLLFEVPRERAHALLIANPGSDIPELKGKVMELDGGLKVRVSKLPDATDLVSVSVFATSALKLSTIGHVLHTLVDPKWGAIKKISANIGGVKAGSAAEASFAAGAAQLGLTYGSRPPSGSTETSTQHAVAVMEQGVAARLIARIGVHLRDGSKCELRLSGGTLYCCPKCNGRHGGRNPCTRQPRPPVVSVDEPGLAADKLRAARLAATPAAASPTTGTLGPVRSAVPAAEAVPSTSATTPLVGEPGAAGVAAASTAALAAAPAPPAASAAPAAAPGAAAAATGAPAAAVLGAAATATQAAASEAREVAEAGEGAFTLAKSRKRSAGGKRKQGATAPEQAGQGGVPAASPTVMELSGVRYAVFSGEGDGDDDGDGSAPTVGSAMVVVAAAAESSGSGTDGDLAAAAGRTGKAARLHTASAMDVGPPADATTGAGRHSGGPGAARAPDGAGAGHGPARDGRPRL